MGPDEPLASIVRGLTVCRPLTEVRLCRAEGFAAAIRTQGVVSEDRDTVTVGCPIIVIPPEKVLSGSFLGHGVIRPACSHIKT